MKNMLGFRTNTVFPNSSSCPRLLCGCNMQYVAASLSLAASSLVASIFSDLCQQQACITGQLIISEYVMVVQLQ